MSKKYFELLIAVAVALLMGTATFIAVLLSLVPHTTTPNENLTILSSLDRAEYYFQPAVYDLAKARQYYTKAIEENPTDSPLAWYQLGRINFIEANFDEALQLFHRQVALFGDEIPNVHYMLGLTYAFRADRYGVAADWQKAEEHFKKFLAFKPNGVWARVDLAWVYLAQDRFVEMEEVLLPVKDEQLTNPWWLNMYGLAQLNLDRPAEALRWLAEADTHASTLTVADWAKVYPENDPRDWARGLREFQISIDRNVAIAERSLSTGQAI